MKVGDIYWVEFPAANGHEQTGRRPAIVLQDESVTGSLPVVLVVPLTANLKAERFVGALRIPSSTENGLTQDSIAMVFQLRAIDRQRLQTQIGRIGDPAISSVFSALDNLMGRKSGS